MAAACFFVNITWYGPTEAPAVRLILLEAASWMSFSTSTGDSVAKRTDTVSALTALPFVENGRRFYRVGRVIVESFDLPAKIASRRYVA